MLGVSGIVPDGVAAVFLTAPDGTAVRADVKDNGYEFLIPRPRTAAQRYVVWTGGDGTPHVQSVVALGSSRAAGCPRAGALAKIPRVSPSGALAPCVLARRAVLPVLPARPARDKRGRLRLPAPWLVTSCSPFGPTGLEPPAPAPAITVPAPTPRKHR
jgi:hypothetical protein